MRTTREWIEHYESNLQQQRVNWELEPLLTPAELAVILPSLQAWQLGETSEGAHLLRAASKYAQRVGDRHYVEAVRLFIREEQKHGANLGRYLDAIGQPRISKNWGDTLFRKIRYFATSMEMWTLAVITVESTAQIFYHALREATRCELLRQICTDILLDEAYHILFQTERLGTIFAGRTELGRSLRRRVYPVFYYSTICVVWFAHRRIFKAGGLTFASYLAKMEGKYLRTIDRITNTSVPAVSFAGMA